MVKALRSGWVPAALALAVTAAVLHHYDVPVRETAVLVIFVVLGGTVPGMLLWRALRGGSRFFAEEVALGTALGHAITVLVYIAARWGGHPLLVLAWPVATIAAFVVMPTLRRHWRVPDCAARLPVVCSWGITALISFTVLASGSTFFRYHGLASPGYLKPYVDMPFHLGLVGELKHHMPPTSPSVLHEPLYYHWFAYADMAATSWVTGIEPQTLLYRLFLPPVWATSLVLLFATARRLSGRWWPGLVALGMACLAWAPSPYPWEPSLGLGVLLRDDGPWRSPTHALGAMLFAAVILLLVDLFRRPKPGAGPWMLFVTLLMAVMGAKATFLPMLVTGLFVVVVVTIVVHRRLHRTALAAIVATVPSLAIAQFVLFGGTSDGMVVHPGSMFGAIAASAVSSSDPPVALKVVVALVSIFGGVCVWGGVFGLASWRKALLDPPVLLLLGISAAGIGVATLLRFPGLSQLFFLGGAIPYMSVVAACGIAAVVPERFPQGSRASLPGAAACGIIAILVVRELGGRARPATDEATLRVLGPFLVLVVIAAVFMVALAVARRRRPALRPLSPVLACAFVTGLLLPASFLHVREMWRGLPQAVPTAVIAPGTLEAGRWLRDHSHADDVVATNSVCAPPTGNGCDNRYFSVSAYTERRVLVENWRFLVRTLDEAAKRNIPDASVPFWDRRRMADNDAVFHHPSLETVRRLRNAYGVRWLFVDRRHYPPAPDLERFVRLRYTAGDCAVYEITS